MDACFQGIKYIFIFRLLSFYLTILDFIIQNYNFILHSEKKSQNCEL